MPAHKTQKSLVRTLKSELDGVARLKKILPEIERAASLAARRKGGIVVTGVGKSAFIGMKIAATLTSLGNRAVFMHPVDALHGDVGLVHPGDIVIALSHSGESQEVIKIIEHLKKDSKLAVISITGNKKSALGKLSDIVLETSVAHEGSILDLAPMASTTAALVAGDLLAASLAEKQGFKEDHFARFHPGGSLGLKLKKASELAGSRKKAPLVDDARSFQQAVGVLHRGGKGIAGIVSRRGILVGVITDGDIRRFFVQHESSRGISVKEVMTKEPKTISPETSAYDALDLMRKSKITALFVIDSKGAPTGLIHMHDLV